MQTAEGYLSQIADACNWELASVYAMGTLEYSDWLDGLHLFCHKQGSPTLPSLIDI